MELEIYDALQAAGVPPEKAKSAVESINKAIDQRYSLHAQQLATRGDLEKVNGNLRADIADAKTEIIKWNIASIMAAATIAIAAVKLFQ